MTFIMADESQAMKDLAYVKDVIEALPPDRKKEFLDYFVKYSNTLNKNKVKSSDNRPSTPVSNFDALKRPLNSPESPKRNKRENKVSTRMLLY